jgi:hypothetical protein
MEKTSTCEQAHPPRPGAHPERALAGIPPDVAVVDCDVHALVPGIEALFPYLSDHWREYAIQSAFEGPLDTAYPAGAPTSARPGVVPAPGEPTEAALALVRRHALDAWGAESAVLNCVYGVDSIRNPDTAAAVASAINDWLIAEWLEPEPRLRASVVVASTQPELAAYEIDRVGSHPGFVQVLLPARSHAPYGNRQFHPIFEAATRRELVVGIHFGGTPGNPPTGTGWPSYYIEEYVTMAHVFQTQLMSIVVEGVFDRFPDARVAIVEGGFAWLPPFLWRFDKDWKGLRRETPWNRRLPSEYVREHVKATTQPCDGPAGAAQFQRLLDQLGSEDILLFSTDYPHWHYDSAADALPEGMGDALMRKVLGQTARDFYRLRGVAG